MINLIRKTRGIRSNRQMVRKMIEKLKRLLIWANWLNCWMVYKSMMRRKDWVGKKFLWARLISLVLLK